MTNDIQRFEPTAPRYRYYVEDLISGKKIAELDFRGVSYKLALNAAGDFSGSLLVLDEHNATNIYDATMPGLTALYILRNDVCVWGGIIWDREYDPTTKSLTVTGAEFTSYLHHRRIWKTWSHEFEATVTNTTEMGPILWNQIRQNLAWNPKLATGTSTYGWSGFNGARITNFPGSINTGLRLTRATTAETRFVIAVGGSMPHNGEIISVRMQTNASVASEVSVYARPTTGSGTGATLLGTYSIPAGRSVLEVTGNSFVGDVLGSSGLAFIWSAGGAVGNWVEFTAIQIENTNVLGDYFDGSTANQPLLYHLWSNETPDAGYSYQYSGTLTPPYPGCRVTMEHGSAVTVSPGSTVKLDFYEPSNFQYSGFYRVLSTPAPHDDQFYVMPGKNASDLVSYEVVGGFAYFRTKENHGYSTGDLVSIRLDRVDGTQGPGQFETYGELTATGGPDSNQFYVRTTRPNTPRVPITGYAVLPTPIGVFERVTVGVRQDTFDYVRSLIQGTFDDFVGTDFPNVYIEPGVSVAMDVTGKEISGGFATLNTADTHGLAVGQAIQVRDVGPEFDGEYEVEGIEWGQSIVYKKGGSTPYTEISPLASVVVSLEHASGVATVTTSAPHGFSVGNNVKVDPGPSYPILSGTWTVSEIPAPNKFKFFTGNSTEYSHDLLTDSSATVGTNSKRVIESMIYDNRATLTTEEPHGFTVGQSVAISGVNHTVRVIEKSLDGPSRMASVQTAGAHNILPGQTVVLKGLSDVAEGSFVSSGYSHTRVQTTDPHNMRRGDTITVSGMDEFRIVAKQISGAVGILTTETPHNFSAGDEVTISGIVDSWVVSGHKVEEGVGVLTTSIPHNVRVNDSITVENIQDSYRVITISVDMGEVTLTTDNPHNLYEGQTVSTHGLGVPYDGEFTVVSFTDQRITYKLDYDKLDQQAAEAASQGRRMDIPVSVPERRVRGFVNSKDSFLTGTYNVSAVGPTTISFSRGGHNYVHDSYEEGLVSGLGVLNGTHVLTSSDPWYLRYDLPGSSSIPHVGVPISDNAENQAYAVRPSIYSGVRQITDVSANTITFYQEVNFPVERTANLTITKPSIFNGTHVVSDSPSSDRLEFVMAGFNYSMVERVQGNGALAVATSIYNGTYTIAAVDPLSNTFSYTKTYEDLGTAGVQNRGSALVRPSIIVSSFGPYPGNADINFTFPDAEYSGINIKPETYRGFELKTVGAALDSYSNNIDGFEYRIDCDYLVDEDRFIKKFVILPINFPNPPAEGEVSPVSRFGADKLVFEYPAGSVKTFRMRESAEESATRFFALGETDLGPDVGPSIGVASADDLLRGQRDGRRWPLLDASDTVDGIDDKQVLHSYAKRFLSELKPPFATFTLEVNGSRPPFTGTYKPGQWCSIVVNDPWMKMRLSSDLEPRDDVIVRKIDSISITVPDGVTFPESVSVGLVAEWEVDTRGQ